MNLREESAPPAQRQDSQETPTRHPFSQSNLFHYIDGTGSLPRLSNSPTSANSPSTAGADVPSFETRIKSEQPNDKTAGDEPTTQVLHVPAIGEAAAPTVRATRSHSSQNKTGRLFGDVDSSPLSATEASTIPLPSLSRGRLQARKEPKLPPLPSTSSKPGPRAELDPPNLGEGSQKQGGKLFGSAWKSSSPYLGVGRDGKVIVRKR
jgi:hypothetical protein